MKRYSPLFIALTCALAAGPASAQNVSSARAAVRASAPVIPALPWSSGDPAPAAPSFSVGLTPTLSAPSRDLSTLVAPAPTKGLSTFAPDALAVAARPVASAITAAHVPYAVGQRPTPALSILSAANVADDAPARRDAAGSVLFDGAPARNGSVSVNAEPARLAARTGLGRAATAVGLLVAAPTAALAAGTPVAGASALTLTTYVDAFTEMAPYHPLAVAVAAIVGALFGLWASRSKDDSPANAGQVFASVLSHGAIAGAGVFALLDLTKVLFLDTAAVGLTSLAAAAATAALAQTAFTAKFLKSTTTSADRIIGAFPAVAAAFGLSLGAAALAAPTGMLLLSTAALALTGAATALFVALFKPERSPAAGPAAMGRGFVLQALMTGLALSVGDPRYAVFFFALGMWGFASVLIATGREAWSALPESLRKRFKR